MIAVGVLTVFPLYFIVITAFKTRKEYLTNEFLPPSHPTLANFRAAFRDGAAPALGRQQPRHHGQRRDRGDRLGARRLSAGAHRASPAGCRSSR